MRHGNLLSFGVLTAVGMVLSVELRYELTWDFLHYHYYNGFAFVYDRLGYDIAPAAINTYFNPLLDALTFLAVNAFNDKPNLYYALTGIPFGLLLFVVFKINLLFFKNILPASIALLIAATGFATWFQIGTSTNEMPVALLVLSALYMMLTDKKTTLAAFILGAAMGLKSTAGIYCLSSGIVFATFNRKQPKRVCAFAVAGLAGFLATNGFWMLKLYSLFQNPFFPFFNALFNSPFFDNVNYSFRTIFKDRTFAEAFFLPFKFVGHFDTSYAANTSFSDIRWAAAFVLTAAYLPFVKRRPLDKQTAFLASWAFLSYLIWLFGFSVIRYLIPVEVILPVFFLKTAGALKPKSPHLLKEAVSFSFFIVFTAACCLTPIFSIPWGNRKEWNKVFDTPDFLLPENTLLLTRNGQNGAIAAKMAQKISSLRILHQTKKETAENAHQDFTLRGKFLETMQKIFKENTAPVALLITSPPFPLPQPQGTKCRLFNEESDKTFSPDDIKEISLPLLYKLTYSHLLCVPEDSYERVFQNTY